MEERLKFEVQTVELRFGSIHNYMNLKSSVLIPSNQDSDHVISHHFPKSVVMLVSLSIGPNFTNRRLLRAVSYVAISTITKLFVKIVMKNTGETKKEGGFQEH